MGRCHHEFLCLVLVIRCVVDRLDIAQGLHETREG